MTTFRDRKDRLWTIDFNTVTEARIRRMTGVDLLDLSDGKTVTSLYTNPALVVNVVWAAIKPEAEARGISDEDFGAAMAGDPIDHATRALLESVADFFPDSRQREGLRMVIAAAANMRTEALGAVVSQLPDLIARETRRAVDHFQATMSGKSSGDSPASSASTPVPSP